MFCIKHHDDLVKYHTFIKKNKKVITDKIKLLNNDTSKIFMANYVSNFNFHSLQKQAMYIYKYVRDNKRIDENVKEYLILFVTAKTDKEMLQCLYTIMNDPDFYDYLLKISKLLSNITTCLELTITDKLTPCDLKAILEFHDYKLTPFKKTLKMSTYEALIFISRFTDPIDLFNIQLGDSSNYKRGMYSIKEEFKLKFPQSNLRDYSREDKIGIMFFAVKNI